MAMHVNVGGTWEQIVAGGFQINVAAAWQTVQSGLVRVAGVWQQFYQNAVFAFQAAATHVVASGTAVATLQYNTNGTVGATGASAVNWITPTSLAPGAYTVRASVSSGPNPTGDALDADLALSSARSWTNTQVGLGSKTTNLALTYKDGGGATVGTGSTTILAQVLT